ncbi:SMP-30/gluconolactonase/LRE family protein [Oceaniglobus trochenteri]|uniref:SMP-30/gluconolactonase/LRE family protein n=1 Tax=Oceaniglobus trochenteri TaxID=2763260 RepID=UPI001CFF9C37|nr:SMP-30/gluconolactonase/LRE family protein [Oceaniglobus trochenteri]
MNDFPAASPSAAKAPTDTASIDVPGTQALMRGIDVLMAVSMTPQPPRFGEIHARVNIPKGTLHRLLAALVQRRLLRYDPRTRRYFTGSRVFELVRRSMDQSTVGRAAKPELSRLAALLRQPACLYAADGEDVFVIDFEDPDASQTRMVRVWPREKAAETAAGQAIAGNLPPETRSKGVPAEIGLAQALGYCIHPGRTETQATTVAAAICDESGFPVAAISVAFEGEPVSAEKLHEAGRLVAESARRASGNVGDAAIPDIVAPQAAAPPDKDLRDLQTGRDFMGENPIWSASENRLYWLDILAPALRSLNPDTGETDRILLPEVTGGLALAADGRLILLGQNGVSLFDPATHDRRLLVDPEADRPDNRFNTAMVAPDGAIWAGTMSLRHAPGQGAMYRIAGDLSVTRVLSRVGMPKNPALSPDGGTLYVSDGPREAILAFDRDPETHKLTNEREFVRGGSGRGRPNGIACDAEGHVWAAMIGGWCLHRYAPDGTLERIVHLPVPMPTSIAFGGPELRTLFITSTYLRLPAGFSTLAPQSGNVFAIDVDVPGQPVSYFGAAR